MTGYLDRLTRGALLTSTAAIVSLGVTTAAMAQPAPGPNDAPTTLPTAQDPSTLTKPVGATEPATPAGPVATPVADTGNEIVVLGTRRTDRTLTNSASPVDVISAVELQSQGASNMLDAVKNIVPSFFVPQNTISDASTFVRAPSLRGLPSDEILVMLNGKRFNRSALVQVYSGGDTGLAFGSQGSDISSIPAIAIKNLQILREGATAQYGSDAIGGVINYGLRDARHGGELQARYGQTYEGDGKSRQIAATIGVGIGARGFIDLSGEYDKDGGTSRGATRPLALVFAAQNPTLASRLPNYPGPVQIWGSSPSHGYKLLLNSAIDVTPDSQLYFFGNLAKSKANESFNYRSPISGTAVDTTGVTRSLGANGAFTRLFYLTPCPANNATCPSTGFVNNGNTFSFTSIYPAGFTPRFVGITKQAYGVLGYKGKMESGFSYDLSISKAKNTLTLSMYNSLNASYGPQSQTAFQFGTLSQNETNANLDLSYPLEVGLASPLTISGGAEYRKEIYGQSAGDPQSYGVGPYSAGQNFYNCTATFVCTLGGTTSGSSPGASGYGGTSPAYAGKWGQSSYGLYGDLETDLTQALSVGFAGRYEHYNTFGGAFVYKANALYKLAPEFSIRGTIGTGFHAPSPGQSHDSILTTNFVAGNQIQTGTYPVDSPISRSFGSTTLGPEKSKNYGLGFIAKPVRNLSLTVDGYIIKVTNRIGISQTFRVTAANLITQPALAAVGVGGDVNFFTNGYDTTTRGIDVVATYRASIMRPGDLNLTLAYNYNKSKVDRFDPGVISPAQLDLVAHLAPNHRATLSGVYSAGPFSLTARENFYSWWRNQNDYPGDNNAAGVATLGQKFGSKFTTDLEIGFDLTRNIGISIGANNLFDTYPDKLRYSNANRLYASTGSTSDGQIYPRTGGPFGINGGFYYARLRVKY